ncbi:hypothetical protein M9980_08125 [Sphingomonas donggukensis]|uniref:Uncharacterized protein n=1 Tax=Sphingomonas donggukensis TaxID=2949093 RepID=A0ABY4TQ81_9SPHN|nr:hypothetical protein [Sphingomonas donggukensis]URW74546.1 hypothetical protein M9980_08125 [Sphingomonas donggukensis]
MDLNYLYSRHQISVMRAAAATTREARSSHRGLAAGYARAIHDQRARFGGEGVVTTLG